MTRVRLRLVPERTASQFPQFIFSVLFRANVASFLRHAAPLSHDNTKLICNVTLENYVDEGRRYKITFVTSSGRKLLAACQFADALQVGDEILPALLLVFFRHPQKKRGMDGDVSAPTVERCRTAIGADR